MKKYIPNILKSYLLITIIVSVPFIISCKKPNSDPEPVVELEPKPDSVSKPVKPICRLSKYLEKKQDGAYGGYQYTYNLDGQVIRMDKLLADSTIDPANYYEITYDGKKITKMITRVKYPSNPPTGLNMSFSYVNDKISSIVYGSYLTMNYTYTANGDIETITVLIMGQEQFKTTYSEYVNGRPAEMRTYDYNPDTKMYDVLSENQRYVYDADNNLTQIKEMNKDKTAWQVMEEFKYDLKIPFDPMANLLTFGLYDGETDLNWDTKNKNKYSPNEHIVYNTLCSSSILEKWMSTITTITKSDEENKHPLELTIKDDQIQCDKSLNQTEVKTVIMRYECK